MKNKTNKIAKKVIKTKTHPVIGMTVTAASPTAEMLEVTVTKPDRLGETELTVTVSAAAMIKVIALLMVTLQTADREARQARMEALIKEKFPT
jgi:DNA-binding MurR/RpiR family transcriptional regulator